MRTERLISLALAGLVAFTASYTAAQEAVGIDIREFAFEPRTLGVAAGMTVRWVNRDDVPHTIFMENRAPGSSGMLAQGASHTFIFRAAGRFTYRCAVHPTMLGEVVVTGP